MCASPLSCSDLNRVVLRRSRATQWKLPDRRRAAAASFHLPWRTKTLVRDSWFVNVDLAAVQQPEYVTLGVFDGVERVRTLASMLMDVVPANMGDFYTNRSLNIDTKRGSSKLM